jgi:hypothetical protein
MKTVFLLSLVFSLSSYSSTGSIKGSLDPWSHNKPYGHTVGNDIVRKGKTSERFEIRHGDCNRDDCSNDRRRIEISSFNVPITNTTWFGWSMYLPEDFMTLGETNTTIGQVKTLRSRRPILGVLAREGQLNFSYDIGEEFCVAIDDIDTLKGKWNDILVKIDFDTNYVKNKTYSEVFLNNKKVCDIKYPVINKGISEVYFRYGIYNSYVSRWLDDNKTKPVNLKTFNDKHIGEGRTIISPTNRPWEIDWGVKLPTQVIYYDEIRIGPTRESVDINLNDLVD